MKNKVLTMLAGMMTMTAAVCYATVPVDNIAIADAIRFIIHKCFTPFATLTIATYQLIIYIKKERATMMVSPCC